MIYLETVIQRAQKSSTGVFIHGLKIDNLCYADVIDLIEDSAEALQQNIERMRKNAKWRSLQINVGKTKFKYMGRNVNTEFKSQHKKWCEL